MSKYDTIRDGRAIVASVREDVARAGVEMSVTAAYDHLPVEHRARIRAERTAAVQQARADGIAALRSWAETAAADARKRLRADPVGSAAEESRRVADELRLARTIEAARAEDARRGLRVPDGMTRAVANGEAYELAARADRAYRDGDLDEAHVLARASVELGGPSLAREIVALVRYDRDAADPAKARAMGDLADVDVVLAVFDRDVTAAVSHSLQDSAALARSLGDDRGAALLTREIVESSLASKLAAAAGAARFAGEYAEPAGALSGMPTGATGGKPPGSPA